MSLSDPMRLACRRKMNSGDARYQRGRSLGEVTTAPMICKTCRDSRPDVVAYFNPVAPAHCARPDDPPPQPDGGAAASSGGSPPHDWARRVGIPTVGEWVGVVRDGRRS